MVQLTDDNVVEECYTMICRVEAALEDVGYLRLSQVEENFRNWHDVVYNFMIELKKYRDNKIEKNEQLTEKETSND